MSDVDAEAEIRARVAGLDIVPWGEDGALALSRAE